jgi:DNA-binding response OmpR family regulator
MRLGANSAPSLRIVVTDDDPKLLITIVEMLVKAGHAVFAAYDGRSACELAEYIPDLDLVISNTRMCNVKTPELIVRVRAAKPWLAILHVGDPLPETGPLSGVPTLSEPFTGAELEAAITTLLASRVAVQIDPSDGSAAAGRNLDGK